MFQLFVMYRFGGNAVRVAYLNNLGGGIAVVEQGIVVAEPFRAKQLLVVQRPVGFAKLRVAFGRVCGQERGSAYSLLLIVAGMLDVNMLA